MKPNKETVFQFLKDMVEVQLQFISFKKEREPLLSMWSLVNEYCMIQNFTKFNKDHIFEGVDLYGNIEWTNIVSQLDNLFLIDKDNFVLSGLELLEVYIQGRVGFDVNHFTKLYNEGKTSPFFSNVEDEENKVVGLHMYNASYPDSFLNHKEDNLYDLEVLAKSWIAKGYKYLQCGSWMNQYGKFLDLFPEEYTKNCTIVTDVIYGHLGVWGQFIDHEYQLNKKTYKKFLEKKDFPYYMTTCKIELKKLIK